MPSSHPFRARVSVLAAAFGIGVALFPSQARAEDWLFAPGASIGIQFLGQRSFSIGPDLVVRYQEKRRPSNASIGAFFMPQVVIPFDGSGGQLYVASGLDTVGVGVGGRVGAALRTGSGPTRLSGGAHLGAFGTYSGVSVMPYVGLEGFFPFLGGDAKHPLSLGIRVGFQVPMPNYTLSEPHIVEGRPLRDRHGRATVAPIRVRNAADTRLDRAAAARHWVRAAQAEHASIAAFSRLSLDLMALAAPLSLVMRAQRAALDEVAHTKTCLAIARRLGAEVDSPAELSFAALDRGVPDLGALAVESFVDGCLNEGAAAACLRAASKRARGTALRTALAALARDEQRHARLGWDIVIFALRAGGAPVREALAHALEAPLAPSPRASRSPLEAHGVLSKPTREAVARRVAHRARARLAAVVASASHETARVVRGLPA